MLRPKQTTSGVIVGNFFGGQHRKWFEIFSIALRAVECAFRARWPSVSVHYMTLAELFLLKNIAFGSSLIVISVPFVVSPVRCSFRRDLNSAELFTEFYSKLIFNNISLLHTATLGILWLLFFGFFLLTGCDLLSWWRCRQSQTLISASFVRFWVIDLETPSLRSWPSHCGGSLKNGN